MLARREAFVASPVSNTLIPPTRKTIREDNSFVDGKMATANLGEFKMATSADVPKLTTVLMEAPAGPIPYQGKAIAEIPNVPVAAAIANAIHDAVGVRIQNLPLYAEKVYAALRK